VTSRFDSLPLPSEVLGGLASQGFVTPTPVQAAALPLLLEGKDAIVQAKTGSGKTLAFGLALLTRLRRAAAPTGLVVVPTRELAIQVEAAIASVNAHTGLRTLAIYGGVNIERQAAALNRGVDLLIATPGRLKDLMGRGQASLASVTFLVLDEADQMLDMGFRPDIEHLIKRMPARSQTVVFSATMPAEIEAIARTYLRNPELVRLTNGQPAPSEIQHGFVRVDQARRLEALVAILRQESPERAIVFTRMKHETRKIASRLEKFADVKAGFLNGNMSQNARNTMLDRFRSGDVKVLVATDVAARGLDIEGLSHVIHYAIPDVVETYIHRSGRTGRNGASGKTIILVTPESELDFKPILRKVHFTEWSIPEEFWPKADSGEIAAEAASIHSGPPPSSGRGRPGRDSSRNGQRPGNRPSEAVRGSSHPAHGRPQHRPGEATRSEVRPADGRTAAPRRGEPGRNEPSRTDSSGSPSTASRSFKVNLGQDHTWQASDLRRHLAQRTGVPQHAIHSVKLLADHAVVVVDAAEGDRFKARLHASR
jgi:ATP-dependent RNA helicase RhlE